MSSSLYPTPSGRSTSSFNLSGSSKWRGRAGGSDFGESDFYVCTALAEVFDVHAPHQNLSFSAGRFRERKLSTQGLSSSTASLSFFVIVFLLYLLIVDSLPEKISYSVASFPGVLSGGRGRSAPPATDDSRRRRRASSARGPADVVTTGARTIWRVPIERRDLPRPAGAAPPRSPRLQATVFAACGGGRVLWPPPAPFGDWRSRREGAGAEGIGVTVAGQKKPRGSEAVAGMTLALSPSGSISSVRWAARAAMERMSRRLCSKTSAMSRPSRRLSSRNSAGESRSRDVSLSLEPRIAASRRQAAVAQTMAEQAPGRMEEIEMGSPASGSGSRFMMKRAARDWRRRPSVEADQEPDLPEEPRR